MALSLPPRSKLLDNIGLSNGEEVKYYSLPALEAAGFRGIRRLPFSIRIVLESLIRNMDGKGITDEDVISLAEWDPLKPAERDIPFKVARVLMQDFTGVPAVVDLAAMREFVSRSGNDADLIQPLIPTDLIIDHSVQVDLFNSPDALEFNQKREMERNGERYHLLKWAGKAFNGFNVLPPSAGICHQVNLEHLATCVSKAKEADGETIAFPDTLVGTDSHTTMVDALGIVGFGVGGIEAEAALLGQPVSFITPRVLGVRLHGKLNEGVTATDFALTLTRLLREKGVVNMFVEFFGEGLSSLSLPDRATLSNMCPEYGATIAIFPVDSETLNYLEVTGREKIDIELVKKYYAAQGMFGIDYETIAYSDVLDVNLGNIVPSVSGPTQPKQQIPLNDIRENFEETFLVKEGESRDTVERLSSADYTRWSSESMATENGSIKGAPTHDIIKSVGIEYEGVGKVLLSDGDVVISSITSCTNTSNPTVMIAAGLLAKKAVEKGLSVDTRKVKTSLGPGSRVVAGYLRKAGLLEYLEKLGFGLVGFGCITCIGNSGPLIEKQSEAINAHNLAVAAVLSGNRNYEARIHRDVRANYLMSPPLLIAFAIAGTVLKDLTKEPLGRGVNGKDVYLKDIWPTKEEIGAVTSSVIKTAMFNSEYGSSLYSVNPYWNNMESPSGKMYQWDDSSTYIRMPPFFYVNPPSSYDIKNARVLAVFGDAISTDHISPAGAIGKDSPAGKYLISKGIDPKDFNSYGSRRGNHEVMMRGTFANNRIKNLMLGGEEGGFTYKFPENRKLTIYDAAMDYGKEKVPLVVLAGSEYGSGSSRDWAAKGPMLLGVRAVIAKSFERIHRSNLVGMGILPLQFLKGDDIASLGIDWSKEISIAVGKEVRPGQGISMTYTRTGETRQTETELTVRLDTRTETDYYLSGGVLNYVAGKIMGGKNGKQ